MGLDEILVHTDLSELWLALAEVPGRVEIVWEQSSASALGMGAAFTAITGKLFEIEASRPDFLLSLL